MELPDGLRQYMEIFIDDVGGKYDPVNKNFTMSRAQSVITRAQSILKLGWRVSSALINALQPYHTAYAEIGNELLKATKFKWSPEELALIEESGVRAQLPKYYALEYAEPSKLSWIHPLFMFSTMETANREKVIVGGYNFALKVFDLSRAKAEKMGYAYILDYLDTFGRHKGGLEYAKDLNADTNYIYDVSDIPRLFRTKLGRVVFQFKTYTVNNLLQNIKWTKEALTNPTPHNIARMIRLINSNILLGGVKLPLVVLREVGNIVHPFRSYYKKILLAILGAMLLARKKGQKKKFIALNTIYRGVFANVGVDLSERIGPDLYVPRNSWDWLGVTAGDIAKVVQSIEQGNPWYETSLQPWLLGKNMYMLFTEEDIVGMRRKRTIISDVTAYEKFLHVIGLTPKRMADVRDLAVLRGIELEEYKRLRAIYIDRIIKRIKRDLPIDDLLAQVEEEGLGITSGDIVREYVRKKIGRPIQDFRTLPKGKKEQYLPLLKEALGSGKEKE